MEQGIKSQKINNLTFAVWEETQCKGIFYLFFVQFLEISFKENP